MQARPCAFYLPPSSEVANMFARGKHAGSQDASMFAAERLLRSTPYSWLHEFCSKTPRVPGTRAPCYGYVASPMPRFSRLLFTAGVSALLRVARWRCLGRHLRPSLRVPQLRAAVAWRLSSRGAAMRRYESACATTAPRTAYSRARAAKGIERYFQAAAGGNDIGLVCIRQRQTETDKVSGFSCCIPL